MANVSRDQSDPPGGESGAGRQTSHPGISSSAAKNQERVTSRAAFVWAWPARVFTGGVPVEGEWWETVAKLQSVLVLPSQCHHSR